MKRTVLFVQGGGEGAHNADARLAASLERELGPDYQVRYPPMPNEASPDYRAWKLRLARELATIGDGAILVGHSLGATVLIMSLAGSEPRQRITGIFLIAAPFVGARGWHSEDFDIPDDIGSKLPDGVPIFLYHGRDDEIVPFAHIGLYQKVLPQAVARRLDGRNHQLNDDLSDVAIDIKRLR